MLRESHARLQKELKERPLSMKIYQLEVKNFRGIRDDSFKFTTPLVCLIGLGDSTKSTILDAIEYTLCPNWFIPFDDSDFTCCDTSKNIEITTTVGPVPEELMCVQSKYGQYLRGWDAQQGKLNDEPQPEKGDIYVLSIRLTVDDTLTPEWKVVTERQPEGANIPYKDRQKFSVSRITTNAGNELAWTRGSALLHMSKDAKEVEKILLESNRKLRELVLPKDTFKGLMDSVQRAKDSGQIYGIDTRNFIPNIDPRNLRGSASTISLHDGRIPFRRMGLGTQRLMSIGLQLTGIEDGSILLIDEIEQALEPHRLKHVLRKLCEKTKSSEKSQEKKCGQIFMTTHSPATLEELGAEPVYCVHYDRNNRKAHIKKIDSVIQGTIRRIPEAFLSPKVVVCEGGTEIGLLRAFEKRQIKENGDNCSFAYNRTTTVDGGGSSAPERAYHLATHDYKACLFIDSDEIDKWKFNESQLLSKGVHIVRWENDNSTEIQIFSDVPQDQVRYLIDLARESNTAEQAFLDPINSRLEVKLESLDKIDEYDDEESLRKAVAESADKNSWYKTVTKGESLGEYLFNIPAMRATEFYKRFESIQTWVKDEQG